MCEFGDGQERVIPSFFAAGQWKGMSFERDLADIPRFFTVTRA